MSEEGEERRIHLPSASRKVRGIGQCCHARCIFALRRAGGPCATRPCRSPITFTTKRLAQADEARAHRLPQRMDADGDGYVTQARDGPLHCEAIEGRCNPGMMMRRIRCCAVARVFSATDTITTDSLSLAEAGHGSAPGFRPAGHEPRRLGDAGRADGVRHDDRQDRGKRRKACPLSRRRTTRPVPNRGVRLPRPLWPGAVAPVG